MKKIYEAPELEVSKFSLAADILVSSDPESDLPVNDSVIEGPGFSW